MNSAVGEAIPHLFRRWVFATSWGWLLGFAFLMLGAVAADLLMGAERAQFYLGLGMGAGIGYAQVRVTTRVLQIGNAWGWASVVGMAVPFVASDILRATWPGLSYLYSLWLSAACGGLLVGLLQRPMLRPHAPSAYRWIPASMAGWMLAATTPFLYGTVPGLGAGVGAALINVAAIPLGGVILGVVTGGTLVWLLRRAPHAA